MQRYKGHQIARCLNQHLEMRAIHIIIRHGVNSTPELMGNSKIGNAYFKTMELN